MNPEEQLVENANRLLERCPTSLRMRDACSIVWGYVALFDDYAPRDFPWDFLTATVEWMRQRAINGNEEIDLPVYENYLSPCGPMPVVLPLGLQPPTKFAA